MARGQGGKFLLRIEDIDQSRTRAKWEEQIYEDLQWLGLSWAEPVTRQSERQPIYDLALDQLWQRNLLYPCTCSRRDIQNALSAPQEGVPQHGPDGLIYPGTCNHGHLIPENQPRPQDVTLRLDIRRACSDEGVFGTTPALAGQSGQSLAYFQETGAGPDGETGQITFSSDDLIHGIGDIVVSRRDMATSYHLSVVLDDAAQGVTHVVRGQDLFEATRIHVLLQKLLGLPTPVYHHHRLIRDEAGKRLAKRDDARAISKYRQDGFSPQDIRALVGL